MTSLESSQKEERRHRGSQGRARGITNLEEQTGTLADAVKGADVFIGVPAANALTPEMVHTMAPAPIVSAMANPVPEISYETAVAETVASAAKTGRQPVRTEHCETVRNAIGKERKPRVFLNKHKKHIEKSDKTRLLTAGVCN